MGSVSDYRERLRALPSFPESMPTLDAEAVPTHPLALFTAWLDDAIDSGERQPSAFTLSTIGDDGAPASRTLIVKDVDERGIQFSSSRGSRKAGELEARPVATALRPRAAPGIGLCARITRWKAHQALYLPRDVPD